MNREKLSNWYKKASLNKQKGNYEVARKLFRKILEKEPSLLDVWFALGELNLQQGQYVSAEECFLKVVRGNPEFIMGHAYLGLSYYHMNYLDKALNSYKNVLKLQPENLPALCNIGLALLNMGLRDEAAEYCRRAIAIDNKFVGAHVLLANVLAALGHYEEACKSYGDAQILQPGDMGVVGGLANALIKLGEYQKAHDIVKPYIKQKSEDVGVNVAFAQVSKKIGEEKKAQERLEFLINKKGITSEQYIQVYFAAGDLCDSTGQYDNAFSYYKLGNDLVNRVYSGEEDSREVDRIISVFHSKKKRVNDNSDLKAPVFIVGMPRSGTSLVEQILSQHSLVFSAGELNKIPELSSKLNRGGQSYPECVDHIEDDEVKRLSGEYMECFSDADEECLVVTDKLPHNFRYLGFIEKLFPGARVIHCKRNPMDTCLSNYFQYFSGAIGYAYKLENIAAHYIQYQRLMRHWGGVLTLPMLEINYEDLVSDQELVSRKMIEFCGLSWESECLNFYESDRVARTASHSQVRKKIYKTSVEKWRKYEHHLEPLIQLLNKAGLDK